jgi:glutathione peroxidase
VLAFPTNDFHQELGTNDRIRDFLDKTFPDAISFPVLGMSSLRDNPVYRALAGHLPNDKVRHNFFKYLVDRRGVAVKLFTKKQDPMDFEDEIEALLDASEPTTAQVPSADAP